MLNFVTTEPDVSVPADLKTLMQVFDLPPLEAKFLQMMLASEEWIGKDELPEASRSMRQVIYKLRMKIEPLKVVVINDGCGRYAIPPSGKQEARKLIERALNPGG